MSIFPSTKVGDLTILYMQSQNLSGCTPEQLVALYKQTYDAIDKEFKKDSHPGTVATQVNW